MDRKVLYSIGKAGGRNRRNGGEKERDMERKGRLMREGVRGKRWSRG